MRDIHHGHDAILRVESLSVHYGNVRAVHRASLRVDQGEVVYLVGRNGAGKTSTLHGICAMIPKSGGNVFHNGIDVTRTRTHKIIRSGVALVPSGRRAFAKLSVEENLALVYNEAVKSGRVGMDLEEVIAMFPRLEVVMRRRAGVISGGEQQMLKMARALLMFSDVLLLDEPSEGLAPIIVREVASIIRSCSENGRGVLIAEQRRDFIDLLPGRSYELERGEIVKVA